MKVCFDTYGCRLNRAEALELEAKYLAAGYELADKYADADIIVLRGCSVTSRAQHDCEKAIAHIKRRYPTKKLIVQGCLPKSLLTPQTAVPTIAPANADAIPSRTARAYLKVQDGCNGNCSFCIVPTFRGKSKSEDFSKVIAKAKAFIDGGYHEIVVTGCNLSLYASEDKRLPELIDALCELSPDCRIRVGSIEPGPIAEALVELMTKRDNFCRFLHLPIQSGSQKVLSDMRRPYTERKVNELLNKATKLIPDIALGCDLMTGFPGETELDFDASKGLLKRHPFSNVHVFPYSERPGTLAAKMSGAVHHADRSKRARELSEMAKHKRSAYAKTFVGKTVEVVIEDAKHHAGWTAEYLWCKIAPAVKETLPTRKNRIRLRVIKSEHDQLIGVPA